MICRICGSESVNGLSFTDWVKPTFTDHDKLKPGNVICFDCLFWFDERSEELAELVGKDKPQRMRNYSHFVVGGEWIPLGKGDKIRMKTLLLDQPFPELAVVAESGQKHIVFRATRNPLGSEAGYVQFEEQSLFVKPAELAGLLDAIETLYTAFSKKEIKTGNYASYRVFKFGLERWQQLENQIRPARDSLLFSLALFLAQKGERIDTATREGSRPVDGDLAGDSGGLQKPLPDDHLAAIRGQRSGECIHQQPGQIRQLAMFEDGR